MGTDDTGRAGAQAADASRLPDVAALPALLQALAGTHVGLCLCDPGDVIRYANDAFRRVFLPGQPDGPQNFLDAIGAEMAAGRGIKLESMPLEDFKAHVRARRREGAARFNFSVDCHDGSWWWVNDYRLDDGWILAVATDMSSVKHEELRLRHAHARALQDSHTDFLTGLANRRHGFARAEEALAALRGGEGRLALAVVDIDHFKRINDQWGHETGDRVLVHFSRVLLAGVRPGDQVSRIGGEEFLVVMPGLDAARATQRLARVLRRIPPLVGEAGGRALPLAASAGVAQAEAGGDLKAALALARADAALYDAKAKGRHRVEAWAA